MKQQNTDGQIAYICCFSRSLLSFSLNFIYQWPIHNGPRQTTTILNYSCTQIVHEKIVESYLNAFNNLQLTEYINTKHIFLYITQNKNMKEIRPVG